MVQGLRVSSARSGKCPFDGMYSDKSNRQVTLVYETAVSVQSELVDNQLSLDIALACRSCRLECRASKVVSTRIPCQLRKL